MIAVTGAHTSDQRGQPGEADQGACVLPDRVARLFRFLPDPEGALQPRRIDPPKASCLPLVAMAKRAQAFQGTAPPRRAQVPSSGCRRFTDEFVAYVQSPGGANGPAQSLFRRGRSPPTSH